MSGRGDPLSLGRPRQLHEQVSPRERNPPAARYISIMPDGPVLLYDGLCGFCDGTVQFILEHDRRGTLRFATLQGDFARDVIARHPEVAGVDSLVLVEPDFGSGRENVYVRSEGALRVARYLGGGWHLARAVAIVPRFLRDRAYDAFARIRY